MADGGPSPSRAARAASQAAAFDRIGSGYDEVFPHKEGQLEAVRWLLQRIPAGSRVLDVGSGTGLPTAWQLVDAGMDVLGIDISPVMVELARTNVPGAAFLQADVLDLAADVGPFHAATAFFSLLMLPRAEIAVALERLGRLLMPGGWLVLAMVEADLDDVPIPFVGSTIRVSGYPRRELRGVVETAGYVVEEEAQHAYAPVADGAPPEVQLFLLCRRP
jgi:ubiquinone/menaquinone biosynthesis C-methylase UbiE